MPKTTQEALVAYLKDSERKARKDLANRIEQAQTTEVKSEENEAYNEQYVARGYELVTKWKSWREWVEKMIEFEKDPPIPQPISGLGGGG